MTTTFPLESIGPACTRRLVRRDPHGLARAIWVATAAATNVVAWVAVGRHGAVSAWALELALGSLCVAITARLDAVGRAAHALGRGPRSPLVHGLAHHLGQLHRAMALASIGWLLVALGATVHDGDRVACALGVVVGGLLVAVAWTARDAVRQQRHDRFERMHRWGGWAALVVTAGLIGRGVWQAGGPTSPAVLVLVAVGLAASPWVGMRRIRAEVLAVTGDIVIVALPGRRSHGQFARISRGDGEWHSFAVATTGDEGPGRYCLVIRRAGDWTDQLARDALAQPGALRLHVRRARGLGFMYHAASFRRILVIATGAGIGPVLPYLLEPRSVDVRCVWIGHRHRQSVGADLVDRLMATGRVTLVDTAAGRPDLDRTVAAHRGDAEAVFVVSNAVVRDAVVDACARRGVPCYGPTFDS